MLLSFQESLLPNSKSLDSCLIGCSARLEDELQSIRIYYANTMKRITSTKSFCITLPISYVGLGPFSTVSFTIVQAHTIDHDSLKEARLNAITTVYATHPTRMADTMQPGVIGTNILQYPDKPLGLLHSSILT
jgi:hypothetical protein